jgi:hypothetical protein
MWTEKPLYDSMPGTFATAWWAFSRALRCWWRGHRGTEFQPEFDGDTRWRSCDGCDRKWEWAGEG